MKTDAEILKAGIDALLAALGDIDTGRFIVMINSEPFDYTEWQRRHFENIDAEDFHEAAIAYAKTHPHKK